MKINDIDSLEDSKEQKIQSRVKALILQFSDKIVRNIDIKASDILEVHIKNLNPHRGAGGTTYVIESALETRDGEMYQGGIVLKFANDLDSEMRNSELLNQVLVHRQREWLEWLQHHEVPTKIQHFSTEVVSPKIIHVVPEVQAIIMDFLEGFTPLIKANLPQEEKWGYLGYALARLHGHERKKVNVQLYRPLFNLLQKLNINPEVLQYWNNIIESSRGGAEYCHGDSHLNNLLLNENNQSLAWIDAMMLPSLDRMDDISYAVSHVIQDFIVKQVSSNQTVSIEDLVQQVTWKWVPVFLSYYKKTYDIARIYLQLPIDFFLGSHLIIRAGMWEPPISDYFMMLGKEFLEKMPVSSIFTK